jgi:hypothetical protein
MMQTVYRACFWLFIAALFLSVAFEYANGALLSCIFLITAIGLWLLARLESASGEAEQISIFVTPLGIMILSLAGYQTISILPALLELPTLEHPLDFDILQQTIIYFLTGASCIWAGFLMNIGKAAANLLALKFESDFHYGGEALFQFSARALLIAILLYLLTVWVAGYAHPIEAGLNMTEFRRRAFSLGATSSLVTFMTLALTIPKMLLFAFMSNPNRQMPARELRFWLLFFLTDIVIFFTLGIRSNMAMTIFLIGVTWHHRYRRIPLFSAVLSVVLIGGFVAVVGELRDYLSLSDSERINLERARENLNLSYFDIASAVIVKRIDSLQRFGEIIEGFTVSYSEGDLLWGKGLLGELVMYFPRELFPFDKPFRTSYYFMELFYPKALGQFSFDYSLFGEGYFNFGTIGLLGLSLAFGVVVRLLYELFRERRLKSNSVLFFWYFWFLLFPLNALNQGLAALLPQTILEFIVIMVCLRSLKQVELSTQSALMAKE